MQLNKLVFKSLVKQIRTDHPDLKVRVFWKKELLPGGANGEYGWGGLHIAVGHNKGWEWNIGTLAHEYGHYLREKRHSATYNNLTYRATHLLYSAQTPPESRKRALYWVLRDEYYTDVEAYKILKKWDLEDNFKEFWWNWANSYNYRIKYFYETNKFIENAGNLIKTPNRKFTLQEVVAPLSTSKLVELTKLIESGKVQVQ